MKTIKQKSTSTTFPLTRAFLSLVYVRARCTWSRKERVWRKSARGERYNG